MTNDLKAAIKWLDGYSNPSWEAVDYGDKDLVIEAATRHAEMIEVLKGTAKWLKHVHEECDCKYTRIGAKDHLTALTRMIEGE